jgi:hypothetical protein
LAAQKPPASSARQLIPQKIRPGIEQSIVQRRITAAPLTLGIRDAVGNATLNKRGAEEKKKEKRKEKKNRSPVHQ